MPTLRQIKAVKELGENGGIVSKAMRSAGYSSKTAKEPKKLTNSVGFKELCEQVGLTDHLITSSLTSDILAKPKNRLGELTLAARLKGHLKDNESSGPQVIIHISNEIAQQNNLIKSKDDSK